MNFTPQIIKMKKSENIVVQVYKENPDHWKNSWREQCVAQLADTARTYLESINPVSLNKSFINLDDPVKSFSLINISIAENEIVRILSEPGVFRSQVKTESENQNVGVATKKKIIEIIQPLVEESLNSIESNQILIDITAREIYCALAGKLSRELYAAGKNNTSTDEALEIEISLLIYYLRRWRMPCAQLANTLDLLSKNILGLRGTLLSIQNRHYENDNFDQFSLPLVSLPSTDSLKGLCINSDLLKTIVDESDQTPAGGGFFHRAMPIGNPVDPSLLNSTKYILSEKIAQEGRDLGYRQYEYTALIFLSLAGMEYLLRSYCPSVHTGEASLEGVLNASGYLSSSDVKTLNEVFGSEGWNIRNRCLHGSFLEIEGRRVELIMESGICSELGVPYLNLSDDGSLLNNVNSLLLEALRKLSEAITTEQPSFCTNWVKDFHLSDQEMEFGKSVRCDLLESVNTAEAWRIKIRDYLQNVTPCLSIPLQEGIRSWFAPKTGCNTLPGFAYLMLLFEPFLRLTLQLAGRSVVQRTLSNSGGIEHYKIQYRMLDQKGLLSPENIEWLTLHLQPQEKEVAEKVLLLAMKCRNAFAHGAVIIYSDQIRSIYGHLIVKAIQLTVEAGERHLQQKEIGN
jgi:hypothetical protein